VTVPDVDVIEVEAAGDELTAQPAGADRQSYEDWQRDLLRRKYHLCKNNKDRLRLFLEAGIPTMQRGYNLACREGCTRPHGKKVSKRAKEMLPPYSPRADALVHLRRDEPIGLDWPREDDEFIVEHWNCNYIEEIAVFINRAPTTVAYRARQLNLRKMPRYYDAQKVMTWLGISLAELRQLTLSVDPVSQQVKPELFPCTDRRGKIKIILVSTMALARGLARDFTARQLVAERGADAFFIKDVIEGVTEIADGKAEWESCHWVAYDHTSFNPFDLATFGLRYDGDDEKMSGRKLDPRALAPNQKVGSDTWRPDNWKKQADAALAAAVA
jgi:hypothetical protein